MDRSASLLRRATISLLSLIRAASSDYVYSGGNRERDTSYVAHLLTSLMPALYIITFIAAVVPGPINSDEFKILSIAILIICILGLGSFTDRVCDSNAEEIQLRADSIRCDPNRGTTWARVRLLVLVVAILLGWVALGMIVAWRGA
jgi:hypothetical protein